ncbi:unnamed protein product [Mytilus coruscus]|uniref:Integrase core domain-containing protein n=1 Tax=Mytilus coruscus TaxID=42192 RepID=A0A6J8C604_MYTCO|nr:unnamed protein product [Mytilus coruscus]
MNYEIQVQQEVVIKVQKALDPMGVETRSRRRLRRRVYTSTGPNFLIHIDGYDKLKPYGICIHGAIDGFSRKMLWLKADYSNNNPKHVDRLYIDHVKKNRQEPRLIRADGGSENGLVRLLHVALRYDNWDQQSGDRNFITGRSNQPIERFWGNLRSLCIQFLRNLFRCMQNADILRGTDPVHIECVRFCLCLSFKRIWGSLYSYGTCIEFEVSDIQTPFIE